MNRLTFAGNFCDIAMCRENSCPYDGSCTQRKVWERLKAYEDTGLEPKEVLELTTPEVAEIARLLQCMCNEGSAQHMLDLFKAESEGRLVVLPCKEGSKVYRIAFRLSGNHEIEERYFSLTYNRPEDFGKSLFLTREEAEAALNKEEA